MIIMTIMDLHPDSPLITLFFGRTTHLVRHAACDVYTASRHILFPEDGRHPCEHGALVDGWLTAAPSRVVVATHSNVIMMRLQRRVAEAMLAPRDLLFVWVDGQVVGGYTLTPITMSPRGTVTWWPEDAGDHYAVECAAKVDAINARFPDRL